MNGGENTVCGSLPGHLLLAFLQSAGLEDLPSSSDPSQCPGVLPGPDRADRSSRALSLHNSITKSMDHLWVPSYTYEHLSANHQLKGLKIQD